MSSPTGPTLPDESPSRATSPQVPPDLASAPPADRLGRYIRAQLLGTGGMGEVWKAWDTELNRWVALKFLKSADAAEIARLRREAQTAATLSHPNITAVYEVAEHAGRPFIAMQFVAGQTLETYPRHEIRVVVEILRDAALAVHHAHQRGVIHRDLKPANLMVELEGDRRRAFVMDFGLAKTTTVSSPASMSGVAVGTPAYMPPEQAAGRPRDVDARSDVYGLGATLFEILTDHPPFKGDDLFSLLMKVIDEEPARPRTLKHSVDADLETIALKCLEKDRARRYASAADLADDLSRWLAGEPIRAHAASMAYRVQKFLAKRRVATGLVAGLVLAITAAAFLARGLMRAHGDADLTQKRLQEAQLYGPLEKELDLLRMKFYQPHFQFTDGDFAKYDALIARIEEQMQKNRESAQARYLVGRCREVTTDFDGADAAYMRALALDADHAPTLLALGRLRIDRAIMLRAAARITGRERTAMEQAEAAIKLIERGCRGDAGAMAVDFARCYLAVLRDFGRGDTTPMAELAEKWKGEPFAEEFLIAACMVGRPAETYAIATRAVERMPSSAAARFWRSTCSAADEDADLTAAIAINPRFVEAYAQRGSSRLDRDDAAGALADFQAAARLRPSSPVYRLNIAEAELALVHLEASEKAIDSCLQIRPDYPEAFMARAWLAYRRNDLGVALREADRAVSLDPQNPRLLNERGRLRVASKEYAGAIADTTRAIEIEPTSSAYMNRSNAKRLSGDLPGASADSESATTTGAISVGAVVARAYLHLSLREFDAAVECVQRAAKTRPRNVDIIGQCAEVLYQADRYEDAKAMYERAIALGGRAVDIAGHGVVLRSLGDASGALADFDRAIAADPRCAVALIGRGILRSDAGDYEAALHDLDAAIQADPTNGSAFRFRGRAHHERGDLDLAVQDYDRALSLNSRDYAALHNRAGIREERGDYEGALADIESCIKIVPKLAEAWISRGSVHFRMHRVDEAIADFTQALTVAPRHASAWYNRGVMRRVREEHQGAIEDLTKAIDLGASGVHVWANRALARKSLGDDAGAIEDFDETLRLDPGNLEALANRGASHKKLGHTGKARADFQQFLKLAPAEEPARAQVQALLRDLKP